MEMLKSQVGLTSTQIRVLLTLYFKRQPMTGREIADEIDPAKDRYGPVNIAITRLRVKLMISRNSPNTLTPAGQLKVSEIITAYDQIAKALKL